VSIIAYLNFFGERVTMKRILAICAMLSIGVFLAPPRALSQTEDTAKPSEQSTHGASKKTDEAAAEKPAANWQQSLKECEEQLVKNNTAQAVNLYVAAIQGAETSKVACSDDAFVDLMAVANALTCSVGSNATAEVQKAIESALKWQMHAAVAICGNDSPAEFHAFITLAGWQMIRDKEAAQKTLEKANAIAPKLESRKPELAKIQKAAQVKVLAAIAPSIKTIRNVLTVPDEAAEKNAK
jgi:hypothetical protein